MINLCRLKDGIVASVWSKISDDLKGLADGLNALYIKAHVPRSRDTNYGRYKTNSEAQIYATAADLMALGFFSTEWDD